jgi:hypothetical protein
MVYSRLVKIEAKRTLLILHLDVEYTETMCSRIFGWKTRGKGLLFTMGWSSRLLFLFFVHAPHGRCFLCNEVTTTEREAPLSTGFYSFSEGRVPGGGIEPGTAVQQSSALSTKPRRTLIRHAARY